MSLNNVTLLDIICKELCIEPEVEWIGNDGNRYILRADGTLYMASMCATLDASGYKALLTGKLRPI